jgi:hypothetical protein
MRCDPKSRSIKAPGGTSFTIDATTTHQILGIPFASNKVPSKSFWFANDVISKDIDQMNTIDNLVHIVNPDMVGIDLSWFISVCSWTFSLPFQQF